MDFKLICSSWINEEDEKILTALQEADACLTAEELSEKTGLPPARIHRTLKHLQQQMKLFEGRKRLFVRENHKQEKTNRKEPENADSFV
jgi:DNA-binding transcriptional regulator YhcF (GntR family)